MQTGPHNQLLALASLTASLNGNKLPSICKRGSANATESSKMLDISFNFTALYFILPATANWHIFDFRANCEHHPADWRQQWPCTVWSGSVRSTKKQPHPLSLWPPASQRESIPGAQGAGQWMMAQRLSTETRSHLQCAALPLAVPQKCTLYTHCILSLVF